MRKRCLICGRKRKPSHEKKSKQAEATTVLVGRKFFLVKCGYQLKGLMPFKI